MLHQLPHMPITRVRRPPDLTPIERLCQDGGAGDVHGFFSVRDGGRDVTYFFDELRWNHELRRGYLPGESKVPVEQVRAIGVSGSDHCALTSFGQVTHYLVFLVHRELLHPETLCLSTRNRGAVSDIFYSGVASFCQHPICPTRSHQTMKDVALRLEVPYATLTTETLPLASGQSRLWRPVLPSRLLLPKHTA